MNCGTNCGTNCLPFKSSDEVKVGMKVKLINGLAGGIFTVETITSGGFLYLKDANGHASGGWRANRFAPVCEDCQCKELKGCLPETVKVGDMVMVNPNDNILSKNVAFSLDKVYVITNIYRSAGDTLCDLKEKDSARTFERWYPTRFCFAPEVAKVDPEVNVGAFAAAATIPATKNSKMVRAEIAPMVNAIAKHFTGSQTLANNLIELMISKPVDCRFQGRHTVIILPTAVPIVGVATCHQKDQPDETLGERLALVRAIYNYFEAMNLKRRPESDKHKAYLAREITRLTKELNELTKQ